MNNRFLRVDLLASDLAEIFTVFPFWQKDEFSLQLVYFKLLGFYREQEIYCNKLRENPHLRERNDGRIYVMPLTQSLSVN